MLVDEHEERLKKIKLQRVFFFKTKCEKCGNQFVHEKMWHVPRWGVNEWKYDWYYCQHCMPTKEAVLEEVDSDGCNFGIYRVDPFPYNPHKTNMIRYSDLPDPVGHPVLVTSNEGLKKGVF